jgi:transposase
MRYELADHEWAAIKPMLPNKPLGVHGLTTALSSMASSGSCAPERPGVIRPRRLAHTPLATIASSAGGGLVSGAASPMHLPATMMPLSR